MLILKFSKIKSAFINNYFLENISLVCNPFINMDTQDGKMVQILLKRLLTNPK